MINPNRSYKQKNDAVVIKVDAPNSYIPYLVVQTPDGRTYEGSLTRCHTQWRKIKVGDCVGFSLQWSIVADKAMLSQVVRRRSGYSLRKLV